MPPITMNDNINSSLQTNIINFSTLYYFLQIKLKSVSEVEFLHKNYIISLNFYFNLIKNYGLYNLNSLNINIILNKCCLKLDPGPGR